MKAIKKMKNFIDRMLYRLDCLPLWWIGIGMLAVVMLPHMTLGEGSIFTIHDQLDESLMNYVLTARHAGETQIPEMMGGINAGGLQPSAVLFLLLYMVMPPFYAFLTSYGIIFLCAFIGMYLVVKELTGSSILAVVSAGCFCMLPFYPVYGLSQMGIPLVLYAFLCLYKQRRKAVALFGVLLFGLTSHLVYTGYVVLGFWLLAILVLFADRRTGKGRLTGSLRWVGSGFVELLCIYLVTNYSLFGEILLGRGGYVSHREEMVNGSMPFFKTVKTVFTEGAQHTDCYQGGLILPILVLLVAGGFFYRKLSEKAKKQYLTALGGLVLLGAVAVFYGVCKSGPVVQWKNSVSGFLHYFQMERFYWIYPAGWYLELAFAFSFWWTRGREAQGRGLLLGCLVLGAVVLPTADTILHNSYFYRNVNQINNGSEITGYISWESYYAEDLMAQLEDAIGRDMNSYRVAHLGISPAPALMHGFYTVDGYSNNYSLEYKHAFRKVIAGELDKNQETAVYFDKWGNRCYLFNSLTGTYWMLEKGSDVQYEGLDFDMEALAGLGCEYLFSGGEIVDAARMGLECLGYYETEDSYWGIWLYALKN